MSRTIEIASNAAASSWTDITGLIPWPGTKWGGIGHGLEVGTGSGFNLDDDAGTRTLPTKRVVRCIETATTPDTVLFKGRVSDKTLNRGQMPEGDAKAFDATLDDNNSQAFGIPIDGWVRGAETGRARALAAIAAFGNGSPRASTVIATTYAPNSNTVSMPKKTYKETDLGGVLRDCAETESKQVFITVDDELFYDLDTSTAYAAGLAITDAGPNLTTQFPPIDPWGEEQGNEFFSGATLKYGTAGSGSVSDVRPAAETAHDYWRTVITDSDANATTAASRLATMLDNQSVEEKTYRCSLKLTAAQVDLIKYGQTVSFRSAAAGVLTPVTLRVASLYWEPVGVDVYLAHLELGVPEKLVRRVKTDGPLPPGPFVPVFETEAAFMILYQPAGVGLEEVEWGTTGDAPGGGCATLPTTGDLEAGGSPSPFTGISVLAPGTLAMTFRTSASRVCGGETMHTTFIIRRSGVTVASVVTTPQVFTFPGSYTVDETVTITDVLVSAGDLIDARVVMEGSVSGVVAPDVLPTGVGGCGNKLQVSGELETDVVLNAPTAGQEVQDPDEVGDGSTTSYTTLFPYAPGSLRVEVSGLDWTAQVTETDPTTGDYDLAYPPPLGSTVKRYYLGA